MFKYSWSDIPWGRMALGTLSLVFHGTGAVLILAGRAAEHCGESLQAVGARVSNAPSKPRRTARAPRAAHA